MTESPAAPSTVTELRFGGVGGQGIVLAGRLLGTAATLFDGKEAVCTQTYGPEARGGASRTDVIIGDEPVDYPFVTRPDILVVFFQEAYARYRPLLKPDGLLITEAELVHPDADDADRTAIPALQIARDLGSKLVTNIVLLGCLTALSDVVSRQALQEAIRVTVNKSFLDLDLRAFDAGYEWGQRVGCR